MKLKKIGILALAFLSIGAITTTVTSCGDDTGISEADAKAALEKAAKRVVFDKDKQEVTGNFTVPAVVNYDNVTYTVEWEISDTVCQLGEKSQDGYRYQVIVDYLNNTEAEKTVTFTATISSPNTSETIVKTFTCKVPKAVAIMSVDEYDAAEQGAAVVVKGVIVAKESYSSSYKNTAVYIQDASGKGGYYAYRLKCETEEAYNNDLAIGNVVIITGEKKLYSGLREFNDGPTYMVVPNEEITAKTNDLTSKINAGEAITADYQNQLVGFTNLMVVEVQEKDPKGRYNIVVGDPFDKTKQFQVRINSYITPSDSAEYAAYEALNIKPGMYISANGICGWYNTSATEWMNSGAQLHPIDADDLKVEETVNSGYAAVRQLWDNAKVDAKITSTKEYTLETSLNGVNVNWTSTSPSVSFSGNKLTISPTTKDEKIIIVGTAVVDNQTTELEFEVTATTELKVNTHAEYVAAADGAELTVQGVVTKIGAESNKNVVFIQNADGAYYLYNVTSEFVDSIAVGNEIIVSAVKDIYNNKLELANVTLIETVSQGNTVNALDITADVTANGFEVTEAEQGQLVTITGVYQGNKKLLVGDKEVALYSYCTLPENMVEGATVTITGIQLVYNTNSQVLIYNTEDVEVAQDLLRDQANAAFEAAAIPQNVEQAGTYTFGTPVSGYTITWTASGSSCTIDGNVLTIGDFKANETVTLTAVVNDGTKEDTYTFEFELVYELKISSYAEYMEVVAGEEVTIKGYVNLISGNNVFLTDDNGNGYYLYGSIDSVQLGEEYIVTGAKDIYKNLHEIKNFTYEKTENTKTIEAFDVTEDITTNGFNVTTANQNKYVTFTGTLTGEKEVTVGQNKVALFYKCATPALPVGSTVTVTGIYSVFNTNSQIQVWSTDSVVDNTEDSVKVDLEIDNLVSLFSSSYALNSTVTITPVYDASVVTVTLPEESKILSYENSVLTITPIEEEVTETITISVQINNETATQEVNITTTAQVAGVENGSVNLVYTAGTTTNMDGNNQAELLGLDPTLFTVVGVKNDAAFNVGLNKSGELRLYGNAEQNGNSLEISIISPENKTATITSIEITFTEAAGATVNGVNVADNTEFVINGASVIIKNANASKTQVKFTSIKINYTIA